MFSSAGRKHSQRNAAETGVFTCNFVSRDLAEKMNLSSAALPYGDSEFDFAGLTPKQAELIDAPYVGEAFAVLECKVTEVIEPKTLSGNRPKTCWSSAKWSASASTKRSSGTAASTCRSPDLSPAWATWITAKAAMFSR